jgi:hypothetical protein
MGKTFVCAYWMKNKEYNVTVENISAAVKRAVAPLSYSMYKGIPIEWVDTNLLRMAVHARWHYLATQKCKSK